MPAQDIGEYARADRKSKKPWYITVRDRQLLLGIMQALNPAYPSAAILSSVVYGES
jgi:hypothetical protein